MRRTFLATAVAAILVWPGYGAHGQVGQDTARPFRRDRDVRELRAELMDRFLDRVSRELELNEEQRARLAEEFRGIQERRRGLVAEQERLRRELHELASRGALTDGEARRLLDRAAGLKAREAELWREEQERLGRVLTPRQQLHFLVMQERFAQRVREMHGRRFDERVRPRPDMGLRRPPGERPRP
ncbi:MAG: hypothetical protein HY702_00775 [Gemmatimonadetes bacterium]|nr:hypothetical protein [Gemmatimonadota bacterium]